MIGVYEAEINTIPSLIVVDTKKEGIALPVITYFHGFTSAKEHNLPLAYLLAQHGYRVILPDSKYHGARENGISANKRQLSFWDIVMQNVIELQYVKDYVDESGLLLDNRFGVAGTSMGGITTSAAMTQYNWIKAAAILMGTPKITTFANAILNEFKKKGDLPFKQEVISDLLDQLANYDLSKQPEKLNQRPLFFWHGEEDEIVPFHHAYTFYEQVAPSYFNPDDIVFIREANRGHKVGRYATLETVKWFANHL
ncbi:MULTISPECIES: prolyl oligopeptidase family serine peptidase [Clostridia]|uniref:prolyl oligopeptidase family serine peptidase n=1 Tax=Clostridia TaxID=186801 RepID=UPI000EA02AD1|nr:MULTISPECIES: prolyl oligopeptidase family serine peptidase [Clostridia]NBJ70942.1 esterase [Roseburia sp. 1XD42-34]RKI75584.1 esterase [Clostridium sp. 1xD42-85]